MSAIQGVDLLTTSFLYTSTGTNNEKLARIVQTQLDEIDAMSTIMKLLLSIQDISGNVLDDLGATLCQARQPDWDDSLYRIYLSIALSAQESSGTIPQLVSIGSIIAGATSESKLHPFECWRYTGSNYLDAVLPLDGTWVLSPSEKDPGNIVCKLEGNIDILGSPIHTADILNQIRAAGIGSTTEITFLVNLSSMTSYSGDPNNISEVAVGNGGEHGCQIGDSGLQNELLRKTCGVELDGDNWKYSIRISNTELNGYYIDELACFDISGTMVAKYTFLEKEKTDALYYIFTIVQ